MDTLVESYETVDGRKVEIHIDESPFSPRENSNLGLMICFHSRYSLGDEHNFKSSNYNSFEEMEQDIIRKLDVGELLPLYLYDHSGITMNTTGFNCHWDSGQVGFIVATKKSIRENFLCKYVTKKIREKVLEILNIYYQWNI